MVSFNVLMIDLMNLPEPQNDLLEPLACELACVRDWLTTVVQEVISANEPKEVGHVPASLDGAASDHAEDGTGEEAAGKGGRRRVKIDESKKAHKERKKDQRSRGKEEEDNSGNSHNAANEEASSGEASSECACHDACCFYTDREAD